MSEAPGLKIALKRGALVAAANWPLVVVQFVAESTLKLLLAVPAVGGVFLVVLLLDADVEVLLAGGMRDVMGAVIGSLRESPVALVAFVLACLVVLLGGSALTFVVKAGTVAVLVDAEAVAGAIERPPLRLRTLRRANRTDIEPFLRAVQRLWRRYLRLGACLLLAYALTAATYFGFLIGIYAVADNVGMFLGWTVAFAAGTSVLIVWVTLLNFFYLLTQMVVAVEDIGVRAAVTRVVAFLKVSLREVAGIFGVVFALVVAATVASLLGSAGLGLISFVPIAAIAMLPLQFAAWLLRGFAFQYLALTALGAYLTQYRYYLGVAPLAAVSGPRSA